MSKYYEKRCCDECAAVHWLEVTPAGRAVCHGYKFFPHATPWQYVRRLGRGYEIVDYRVPPPDPDDEIEPPEGLKMA